MYNKNGLVLTNAHVVEGASRVDVYFYKNTRPHRGQILGRSTCDDLAAVKVNAPNVKPVTLGDSDQLKPNQQVISLGYSNSFIPGRTLTSTPGTVLWLHLNRNPSNDQIALNSALHPGDSGGPLLNLRAEVVGIDFARLRHDFGTSFAISINSARQVVQTLATGKDQNWLGIDVVELDPFFARENDVGVDTGVLIQSVTVGGPADLAELKVGDVIQKMGNTAVDSFEAMCDVVKSTRSGTAIQVTVQRGEEQVTTSIKPR